MLCYTNKKITIFSSYFNSFMTEVSIVQKPVHWCALKINGLVLYYKDLRHERVKHYIPKSVVLCRMFFYSYNLTLTWRRCLSHIETSPLICSANQWTGFYMIWTSVVKELIILSFFGHTTHITTCKARKMVNLQRR